MPVTNFPGPVQSDNGFEWAGAGITLDVVSSATRISSASIAVVSHLNKVRGAWAQIIARPGAQLSASGVARLSVRWSNATVYVRPWRTSGSVAPSSSYGATIAIFAFGDAVGGKF